MAFDTDVLIVGAGPTGLMMACQLLREGIRFRILDQQAHRVHESRAFAIQAKSMEIFKNLGLSDEFLKLARVGISVAFFSKGKLKVEVHFGTDDLVDSPFSTPYFLSQVETERILVEHLEKHGVSIDRETVLKGFTQDSSSASAEIQHLPTGKVEFIHCQYLVGCDGAHSTVRHALNLSFEGAPYLQEFILADVSVQWPFSRDKFLFFSMPTGVLIYIPIAAEWGRIMIMQKGGSPPKTALPTLDEITALACDFTQTEVKLSHSRWMSRFHLHHRGVNHYRQGRAFLAGDAAHIHSPVGGQGMNTGLQDAANLAWKLAVVLKAGGSQALLDSYESERLPVGRHLLKTTDRIFSLITSYPFISAQFRHFLFPRIIQWIFSHDKLRKRAFRFISQLGIYYSFSDFVYEEIRGADAVFKAGPRAGMRAPDAPAKGTTLFELMRGKEGQVLMLTSEDQQLQAWDPRVKAIAQKYKDGIHVHSFVKPSEHEVLFQRYGVTSSAVYFVRPDGYIGFRSWGADLSGLETYLGKLYL